MLHKLKLAILPFMALITLLVPVVFAGVASAQIDQSTINSNVCGGTGGSLDTGAECNQSTETAEKLVTRIVNIISLVIGVLAVLMIIFGGLRYITSGGKEDSVKTAKHTIMYALIGLVIVALAQLIVRFVLGETTDAIK